MKSDVELGGTDQKFNLLVGRELQKHYGQIPQCVLMMPLLEGLDGVNKMSKSLGNYVGINEPPREIFGKLMSVSDELMWRYFELLSFRPDEEVRVFKREIASGRNPRDVKVMLAQEIVARFHGAHAAVDALTDFETRFRQGAIPEDIPDVAVGADGQSLPIAQVLKLAGLTASTSESLRMIAQGGIKLDGAKIEDKALTLKAGASVVLQVGKRKFARVKIK
jgi:tyrosyl-tRNA synthetase